MAEAIGALHVEISANSAKFRSETEKTIHKARETAREMGRSFSSSSKSSRGFANKSGKDAKIIRERFTNMEATVTASSAAMRTFGVQGNDAINTITSSLTQMVTGGLGPWSLAIGVALTALQFFISGMEEAETEADRLQKKLKDPTSTESLDSRREAARAAAIARRMNVSTEEARILRQQLDLRQQLALAEARVSSARASGATDAGVAREEAAVRSIEARLVDLESRRKLAEEVRRLEEGLAADTLRSGSRAIERSTQQLNEELTRLFERSSAAGERVGESASAAIAGGATLATARIQQLQDQLRELQSGGAVTTAELRLIRELTATAERARTAESPAERSDARARQVQLEKELDLTRKLQETREQIAADRKAAARASNSAAATDELPGPSAAVERLLAAEQDLAFELEQLDRSETERRVAEFRRRYAKIIEEAKKAGHDTAQLEALVNRRAETLSAVAPGASAPAAEDPAARRRAEVASESFGRGVKAQIEEIAEETTTLGQLGAGVASDLRTGFSDIFEGAVRGADDLTSRLDKLSDRLQSQLIQFGFDRLLSAGFTAVGLVDAPGKTKTTTDEPVAGSAGKRLLARGGSFKVGGVGSVDSKLIQFHATPGELIEATPPGRQRGAAAETRVIVENPTAAPARTETRRRPDGGRDVFVTFEHKAAKSIREGGPLAKAIQDTFGTTRGTRRR